MNNLTKLIHEIESYVSEYEAVNLQFSKASVGWQIEHTMQTINIIIYAIEKSDPSKYEWSFKLYRYIILALGMMPRGKVRAPSVVFPSETISLDSLKLVISKAKHQATKLDCLPSNAYFKHPYLGDMKLNQAIRLLEIHTKHHLSIIRDILR